MDITVGIKKEMTQLYDNQTGAAIPVTVVDVSEVKVANKHIENGQATHFIIGKDKRSKPNKPSAGKYSELGYVPMITISVKLKAGEELPAVGTVLGADMFSVGDTVDVTGTTKGKGFQGVVKRWGQKGGPKTHGQSDKHRSPGSIGSGTTPGRVVKGKRMPGHMGTDIQTTKNLKIVAVDTENNLIMISGAVPGFKGSYVTIKKAAYAK